MPRTPAKYGENKAQRNVRKATLPVKPTNDEVTRAFHNARQHMQLGFGITRTARDELMFRAGYGSGYLAATMEAL